MSGYWTPPHAGLDYDNLPQYLNKELKEELKYLEKLGATFDTFYGQDESLKAAMDTCASNYNAIEEELIRREAKFYWWTHNTIG